MNIIPQEGKNGGLDEHSESQTPVATKSVTLVDAYTPITVHDQYGNPYICLNFYEAQRVSELIGKLDAADQNRYYDTGDWWIDLPAKIIKWMGQI